MSLIQRAVLCMLLWWILVEGDPLALLLGVPVVAAALLSTASWRAHARYRIVARALPRFAAFFLLQSFVAGLDVARRILMPSLPLQPGWLVVPLRVGPGAPQWLLSSTLSLMPGTLGVRIRDQYLRVHCLDVRRPVQRDIERAQQRIAALLVAMPEGST